MLITKGEKQGNVKNNKGTRNRKRYTTERQTDELQERSGTQKRTKYNKKVRKK